MGKRIRYAPTGNAWELASVKLFDSANGESCRIYLNVEDRIFVITDMNRGNQVILAGTALSLGSLKLKAKKALESLGVTFEEEKRNKIKNSVDV